jgi:hypothetical protein
MPGVLILVGERQDGTCCDVIVSGFCGLVLVGLFGFPPVFGFCGCFSSLPSFFCFWCHFCILHICLEAPLRFL